MKSRLLLYVAAAGLILPACSSRPREFTPTLAAPAADQARFDLDHAECRELLVAGKLDSSGRAGSAAVGTAAGAAAVAGGAAAASSAGLYAGAAVLGATLIAAPFVAVGGAWAMARAKRSRKEKAIQHAMAGCLDERGHEIVGWSKAKKAKKPAAAAPGRAASE